MRSAATIRRRSLPAEFKPEQVVALVDPREQTPWNLAPLKMEQTVLQTADYTFRGGEHSIRIERKELSDLVSCCGPERDRFEREIERLLAFPARLLVIEASWDDIRRGAWRSKMKPAAVEASLLSWQAMGIAVHLAGDRQEAERFAARVLFYAARREWRRLRAMAAAAGDDDGIIDPFP